MNGDERSLLERIDERTANTDEMVKRLYQEVFTGNGHPSLTTRVATLETAQACIITSCSDCKRTVIERIDKKQPEPEKSAEGATLIEKIRARKEIVIAVVTLLVTEVFHIIQTAATTPPKTP